jgi:hypothetical protein
MAVAERPVDLVSVEASRVELRRRLKAHPQALDFSAEQMHAADVSLTSSKRAIETVTVSS